MNWASKKGKAIFSLLLSICRVAASPFLFIRKMQLLSTATLLLPWMFHVAVSILWFTPSLPFPPILVFPPRRPRTRRSSCVLSGRAAASLELYSHGTNSLWANFPLRKTLSKVRGLGGSGGDDDSYGCGKRDTDLTKSRDILGRSWAWVMWQQLSISPGLSGGRCSCFQWNFLPGFGVHFCSNPLGVVFKACTLQI